VCPCLSCDACVCRAHINVYLLLTYIHPEFLAFGQSAVDLSVGARVGRRYGGTAVLYHKSLSPFIKLIESYDSRLTALKIDFCKDPILLVYPFACRLITIVLKATLTLAID